MEITDDPLILYTNWMVTFADHPIKVDSNYHTFHAVLCMLTKNTDKCTVNPALTIANLQQILCFLKL